MEFNLFSPRKDCDKGQVRDPDTGKCQDPNSIRLMEPHVYDYLEGPMFVKEYYSPKYDKHIYLFADIHIRNSTCESVKNKIGIVDFLKKTIVMNHDKVIDFFMELPVSVMDEEVCSDSLRSKKGKPTRSYLEEIRNEFSSCCGDKKSCEFDNLRYHIMDNRQEGLIGKLITKIFTTEQSNGLQFLNDIRSDFLEAIGLDPISLQDWTDMLIPPKTRKQLVKSNIQKELYETFENQIELSWQAIKSVQRYYKKESPTEQVKNISNLFTVPMMDIYILSRMFRTFQRKKNEYSETPKNILVYAGMYHINLYSRFLTKLGFKLLHKAEQKDIMGIQCIHISELKQPFFSPVSKREYQQGTDDLEEYPDDRQQSAIISLEEKYIVFHIIYKDSLYYFKNHPIYLAEQKEKVYYIPPIDKYVDEEARWEFLFFNTVVVCPTRKNRIVDGKLVPIFTFLPAKKKWLTSQRKITISEPFLPDIEDYSPFSQTKRNGVKYPNGMIFYGITKSVKYGETIVEKPNGLGVLIEQNQRTDGVWNDGQFVEGITRRIPYDI
jgi:hypothetical protein